MPPIISCRYRVICAGMQLQILQRHYWPQDRPYGSKEEMARQALHARWEEVERDLRERRTKERVQAAAVATTGDVLPSHRPKQVDNLSTSTQSKRASLSGISVPQQKKLDRLARDYPALLESVRAGTMSVHAACIEAGISEPTITVPLDPEKMAHTIRRRLSDDELDVLRINLTAEGRAATWPALPPCVGLGTTPEDVRSCYFPAPRPSAAMHTLLAPEEQATRPTSR